MRMQNANIWRRSLLFGFVTLFLCGIGDWLIGYEPSGGEPMLFGFMNTALVNVPAWFYVISMLLGILSGFGCKSYAPAMTEILEYKGIDRNSKMFRVFRFGFSSAPLMFVTFHTACCIELLIVQAALRGGFDPALADQTFRTPIAFTLIPFTIWCFVVDIPITVAYMYFVLKGKLGLPKSAFLLCPLGMSLLTKVFYAVMIGVGLKEYAFLAGCGESWGHAFMCLAFLKAIKPNTNKEQ